MRFGGEAKTSPPNLLTAPRSGDQTGQMKFTLAVAFALHRNIITQHDAQHEILRQVFYKRVPRKKMLQLLSGIVLMIMNGLWKRR